jgi:GT2 family glycosyltransferase
VAAQTLLPRKVIVVDDSSSDDTVAVARDRAVALSDLIAIQIISNTGPRGPSAARNLAIRASDAAFIALLDADDILAPGHHAALLRVLKTAGGAVLAFADSTVFDASATRVSSYLGVSGITAQPTREIATDCFTLDDGMFAAMLRNGVFGTSACLFRREAALTAGLFDETMMQSEDTDFFLRLALEGRFVFSRTVVTHKRVHEDNLSHNRNKLAFCRGTARSLTKLASRSDPRLAAAQQAALRPALHEALQGYLYHASCAGVSAYWDSARLARSTGNTMMAANPRHLARLAMHSFG